MKQMQKEDRLQKIMQLRECQKNNTNHVNVLAGIMTPEAADTEAVQENNQTQVFLFNGKLRLVLCLFIYVFLWVYAYFSETDNNTFVKDLQSEIQRDYSDNVVAFVKDFTYTLDYEKISFK